MTEPTFDHERLDVYRLSIEYVAFSYRIAKNLRGIHRPARDQWLRAAQSIPLNIARGNGKQSLTHTLMAVVCICAFVSFAHGDTITIGSPAPKLSPEKFVLGTSITKLQRGQRYVIEFSGTACIACIECIPLIEELKRKHQQFIFISVFSEPKDDVRRFLRGSGAKMSTHVACDSTGAVNKDWMQSAGIRGIPFVFVVNEDLEIAWMGSPVRLATVLPILAEERTVTPNEYIRATLMQHAALRQMRADERWNEAQRYRSDTINRLVNEGRHAEAIVAIDRALETYRDLPDVVDELRTFKLYEMARVPVACSPKTDP